MLQVTADALPRLMACNGSRLMEGFTPSVAVSDFDRQEGIAAHWLIEQVFNKQFGTDELIDRQAPNGVFITAEMIEHVTPYLDLVTQGGSIEFDTSFEDGCGVWQINGRADHVSFENGVLTVTDFKYGWSITEPENNWTLIAHAIGYGISLVHARGINLERDVKEIEFVIVQPRPYHPMGRIRVHTISVQRLIEYHKELDAVLSNPTDMLNTGQHCKHCPAMVHCSAFSKAQMNAIDATETAFNDSISNDALSFVMDTIKRAQDVLNQAHKAYVDLATHRLREGQYVPNYAVQTELTNRQWKDFVTPETVQVMTGQDLTKKQLVTPAQAEKAGVPAAVVESLCERRNKGFKLVRIETDKLAKKLFNNPKGK